MDHLLRNERAYYLAHLLKRDWTRATVIGTACKLAAFAARVDINCEGGVTVVQIEAAAENWMSRRKHYFRCDIGPRKARTKFVNDATNWLRFIGRLKEPECSPVPYADLLAEFCVFLEQERELSSATIRKRRHDTLAFLAWFEQQHRPFNDITIRDVERFLALPRSRSWSRVTIAGCVASLRSFFRYAEVRKWCAPNIAATIDAPRLYTLDALPAGPSWTQVRQLIAGIGKERPGDIRNRAIIMLPVFTASAVVRSAGSALRIWIGSENLLSCLAPSSTTNISTRWYGKWAKPSCFISARRVRKQIFARFSCDYNRRLSHSQLLVWNNGSVAAEVS